MWEWFIRHFGISIINNGTLCYVCIITRAQVWIFIRDGNVSQRVEYENTFATLFVITPSNGIFDTLFSTFIDNYASLETTCRFHEISWLFSEWAGTLWIPRCVRNLKLSGIVYFHCEEKRWHASFPCAQYSKDFFLPACMPNNVSF